MFLIFKIRYGVLYISAALESSMPIFNNQWLPLTATLFLFGSIGIIIPILPKFTEDLGYSKIAIGLLSGIFWIIPIFLRVSISSTLEHVRKKPWVAGGLITTAIACCAIADSQNLLVLGIARLIQGIGFTTASMGLMALCITEVEADKKSAQFSTYSIVCFLGYALGPAVGEFIAQRFSYAAAFYIPAVLCSAAALTVALNQENIVKCNDKIKTGENKWHEAYALNSRHLQLMMVAAPLGMSEVFVPVFSRENGYGTASAFFFVFACSMLAVRSNIRRLTKRLSHTWLAATGALLCAAALIVLTASQSKSMLIVAAMLMGLGWGLIFPSLIALNTIENPSGGIKQIAMFSSAYDLSFFAGQISFGILISMIGYRSSFAISAIFCMAASILVFKNSRLSRF